MSIEHNDSKKYFAPDEPVSGGISSGQPSDDINIGAEDSVEQELTEQEKKALGEKIERYYGFYSGRLDNLMDQLNNQPEEYGTVEKDNTKLQAYDSVLFAGDKFKNMAWHNPYIDTNLDSDGKPYTSPIDTHSNETFRINFFTSLVDPGKWGEELPETFRNKIFSLFEKINLKAKEITELPDIKEDYVKYKRLRNIDRILLELQQQGRPPWEQQAKIGQEIEALTGHPVAMQMAGGMNKDDENFLNGYMSDLKWALKAKLNAAERDYLLEDNHLLLEYRTIFEDLRKYQDKLTSK